MSREQELDQLRRTLCSYSLLLPVQPDQGRSFNQWELASLLEGCFGETHDPNAVTSDCRERLGSRSRLVRDEDPFTDRYWITDNRQIVGTIGVGRYVVGWGSAYVSSLYVHPGARQTGLAWRALDSVYTAALAAGLDGIRLDTCWTWQNAVRYYLSRGFWVSAWKRNLSFTRLHRLPSYAITHAGDSITLLISHDESMTPLLVAERAADRLVLHETRLHQRLDSHDAQWTTLVYGRATLAVHLALNGWPLIRSETAWTEAPDHSDIGQPEGLAYKIRIFEDEARTEGWQVLTPTIPGVPPA